MAIELLLAVYGVAILFLVTGAFVINRVSGRAMAVRSFLAKPFRILLAPLYVARVAAVFVLVVVGIAFLLMAPYYVYYTQITGYSYRLEVQKSPLRYLDYACYPEAFGFSCSFIERYTLGRAVTDVSLIETPIYRTVAQLMARVDFVLFGIVFLIAGLILTAYFLAKSNTEAAKAAGTWVDKP